MATQYLISGISGFVGTNLKQWLLKQGHQVVGISRQSNAQDIIGWEDVFSQGSTARVWVHLAGKAHDVKGNADLEVYRKINFDLTRDFYNAFIQSDAEVFVFMSSVKAAADRVEGILTETAVPNPETPYGRSKLQAEDYLMAKLPPDKRVYILRPCMIHGPGNRGNLNLLYQFVKKGIPWPLAAFDNHRSFLSIDNLCVLVEQLSESHAASGIYQLADDEAMSTNDLIQLMGETLKIKVRSWYIPKSFIRFLARLGDVLHLPLNSNRLQKLTENYLVSNNKVKETLQIELPVKTREGFIRTFKSFELIKA